MISLHCNALQHTATHCNTLQHTATQCTTTRMIRLWSRFFSPFFILLHNSTKEQGHDANLPVSIRFTFPFPLFPPFLYTSTKELYGPARIREIFTRDFRKDIESVSLKYLCLIYIHHIYACVCVCASPATVSTATTAHVCMCICVCAWVCVCVCILYIIIITTAPRNYTARREFGPFLLMTCARKSRRWVPLFFLFPVFFSVFFPLVYPRRITT